MTDPEESLSFKLKREQFNNRIPELVARVIKEFGDDKKYLLEYMLWMVAKHFGDLSVMDDVEYKILETYFGAMKDSLGENPVLKGEVDDLYAIDSFLGERLAKKTRTRAKSITGNKE